MNARRTVVVGVDGSAEALRAVRGPSRRRVVARPCSTWSPLSPGRKTAWSD